MAQQFFSDIAINSKMEFGSQQAYTLPAQGTRMRVLQIADNTLCRVYLESSENSYHQPIVLDIFYRAQYTTSKPQIVRSESYEFHQHSNDIIFTSDQAGTAGADSFIYFEKVSFSTGRNVNIRKVEVFDGTLTVLDGSTTDTNGGTDEAVISTFAEVNLGDSDVLKIGDGNDLQLLHDGSNSHVVNYTGDLKITNNANDKDVIFNCDDGSGGNTAYITLDGSAETTIFSKQATFNNTVVLGSQLLKFADNGKAYFGDSNDLQLYHDGTDSIIDNLTGNFYIRNQANDKDIVFICDDGSGGTETYFFLDGNAGGANPTTIFPDNARLAIGSGQDLKIYHSPSISYIDIANGNLTFRQTTDDSDIIFQADDQSGGITTYFTVDGSTGMVKFEDDRRIAVGSGEDTHIYHDGSNSYIAHQGTGHLKIRQTTDDSDIIFECDDGSGGLATYLTLDGSAGHTVANKEINFGDSVEATFGTSNDLRIYHDGSNSYVNDSGTGVLVIASSQTNMQVGGANKLIVGTDQVTLLDNIALDIGTGGDLAISHDGTDSFISNDTGHLYIKNAADDKDIEFQCDDGSGGTTPYLRIDGSASLNKFFVNILHEDSVESMWGTGEDLKIKHNGSDSLIRNFTGDLYIRNAANNKDVILESDDGSGGTTAYITLDGSEEKVVVNKPSQRTFEVSDASTHGDANGDIVYFGGTTSMSAGQIYHYKANGTWELADADAASTSDGLLAVAIGAASDTNGMLLRGMVTLDHDPGNLGDVLFLSTTAGQATGTAPSGSGDIVRVVGYLLGGAHGQIYFNPDGAFVEVA